MLKKFKIINLFSISLILLLSGCASVSVNTYQDGKPLGKGKVRVGVGAEMSPMMNYGLYGVDPSNPEEFDNIAEGTELEEGQDSTIYYWLLGNLNLQYGLTDKIDIGVMPFTDVMANLGTKMYMKYAFMPEDSKYQLAVVPYYGFGSFSGEDTSGASGVSWDMESFAYNTTYYGLDVPFSFTKDMYLTFKVYSDKLNSKFTYYDKPGQEFTPSLDSRTSFGVAFGADTPGEYGRVEVSAMFQKTPKDEWQPRIYVGYNKFFEFGGNK